ncbi:MAG TPA: LysE/ArgO family amino acid transporter [Microlunatus sp.]|jgi:L-lysine exporter family protein LysE/ArgO|nr:LysE/ArgO family amino acid transporter [Microlunatus sp.]
MTLLAGLGFGLGLIVAIGAQNSYVLRQGLRREHVGIVVAICAASDVLLITAGAAGLGTAITRHGTVLAVVTIGGAVVLLGYAAMAVRRAVRPAALTVENGPAQDRVRLGSAVLAALALTWLNPHVYLDTVVLLGTVSASYARPWLFAVGAAVGSVVWFTSLGFGARALAPVFARPGAWRVFDAAVAVVMTSLAVKLVVDLLAR